FLAERAVVSRPMYTRIRDAARTLHAALPGDDSQPARRAALLAIAGQAARTGDTAVPDEARGSDCGPAWESPAFRRLLAGRLLSSLGSSMTAFAVVLQVWELSRSSLDVGQQSLH